MKCVLCSQSGVVPYLEAKDRNFFQCVGCELVFVPEQFFLTADKEKSRYDEHNNDPNDERYRNFLRPVFDAVSPLVKEGARGLDFGSGPGPTLSKIFEENGFVVDIFDVFYANFPEVFEKKYDFVTATEVVEHLHDPKMELDRLWNLINEGGLLAIMTSFLEEGIDFANWYYRNDPTHVCFFSKGTFEWLANEWNCEVEFPSKNIVLFRKG